MSEYICVDCLAEFDVSDTDMDRHKSGGRICYGEIITTEEYHMNNQANHDDAVREDMRIMEAKNASY